MCITRSMRSCLSAVRVTACLLAAGECLAQAQWPQRPVRIIVPFPAGGSTMESVVRLLTTDLP